MSGQHPRKAGGDERGSTEEAQPTKSKRQKHFFVIKVKSHFNESTSFNSQTLIFAFGFVNENEVFLHLSIFFKQYENKVCEGKKAACRFLWPEVVVRHPMW